MHGWSTYRVLGIATLGIPQSAMCTTGLKPSKNVLFVLKMTTIRFKVGIVGLGVLVS